MKLNENYTFLKRIKLIFYDNLSLSILLLPYLLLSSLDDEIGIKLDLFFDDSSFNFIRHHFCKI